MGGGGGGGETCFMFCLQDKTDPAQLLMFSSATEDERHQGPVYLPQEGGPQADFTQGRQRPIQA
jgi:hypothetical protein